MRPSRAAGGGTLRRRDLGAFTLIELLTVMAIILILAGLILSIAGYANSNAGAQRAKSEIQALSLALENFKTDNGSFPRSTATDTLDPRANFDPGGSGTPTYSDTSLLLYKYLSGQYYFDSTQPTGTPQPWVSGTPAPFPKYYTFTNSQLKYPTTSTPAPSGYIDPKVVTAVLDPFGLSYGYSTIYQYNADQVPTPSPMPGFNPTFDLWSTGGYGTAGKAYSPSPSATSSPPPSTFWIKNW